MFKIHRSSDNGWVVTKFENTHNHNLTPGLGSTDQWRSHNSIDEGTKEIVRNLMENQCTTTQMYGYIACLHGGASMLPFNRKFFTRVQRSIRQEECIEDVQKTMDFFRDMQSSNANFFVSVDFGKDQKLQNVFWSHSWSRLGYEFFGDVVTFDTTYQTNMYGMPFAPFIGVNNHFQSIVFGCALVRDESAESFKWLFRTFLVAMNGKHPKAILTGMETCSLTILIRQMGMKNLKYVFYYVL